MGVLFVEYICLYILISIHVSVLVSDIVHGFAVAFALLAKPGPVTVHRLDLLAIKVRDRIG